MHFDDLKKIIHLAHSQNIQISAKTMNITAGALSKTLKKVENQLNTRLFDRVGRNIQLNPQGKKFVGYALQLTHEYDQMCSEFTDSKRGHLLKISGPSVLLDAGLKKIIPVASKQNIKLDVDAIYEGDAIKQLLNGQTHIAIVTNEVVVDINTLSLSAIPLGTTQYKIVAGRKHKIFTDHPKGNISIKALLNYSFICPKTSPFCGIERGIGSDGWLDHKYPRKILSRSDDLNALLSIVNQHQALSYIPDILIDLNKHKTIHIHDYSPEYTEGYSLVYKPSTADGWLNKLMMNLHR